MSAGYRQKNSAFALRHLVSTVLSLGLTFGLVAGASAQNNPTITGTPPASIAEDTAYTFMPGGGDVDAGDTPSYTLSNNPDWLLVDTATGTLSGTPTNADVGENSGIVLTITAGGETAALTFSIEVTNTNDAPTISGTPPASIAEDSAYSFTPGGGDIDANDTPSYSLSNYPDWLMVDTATGELSGTPANDDVGTHSDIVLTITAGGEMATLTFSIEVINTNDAPTITGTPPDMVAEDTAYSFTLGGGDVDVGDTLTYSLSNNKPAWLSVDATGTLSGTPDNDDVGTTMGIVISVSDGASLTLTAFNLEVTNVNDAPTGEVGIDGAPTRGQRLIANITSVRDDDGLPDLPDTFTYQWQSADTASTMDGDYADIMGATSAAFVLTQAQVGKFVRVSVSYRDMRMTRETLDSGVTAKITSNTSPGGEVTITGTTTEGVTLMASATIMDDDSSSTTNMAGNIATTAFTYQWRSAEADGIYTDINGATDSMFTLTQEQVGRTITVKVSYTDGKAKNESLTSTPTAAVTNVNDEAGGLPMITGTVTQRMTLTAVITGITDADGLGTFTYQWQSADTASTMDGDYADIMDATNPTFVLTQVQVGKFVRVSVSYTDDGGMVESLTSVATTTAVTDVNDAPTITGMPPTTIAEDSAYSFTLGGGDVDVGDTLTYSLSNNNPAWLSVDATGTLSGTPDNDDVGTTMGIVVSVSDGTASASLVAFNLAVTNANDAPTITGMPPTTIAEDSAYSFTLGGGDIDAGDMLTYSLSPNSPEWLSVSTTGTTTVVSGTPDDDDVGTTMGIVVSVSDGTVSASLPAFNLAVTNVNDAPMGAVTITGTATLGATLTADPSAIMDADGLGTFAYQWRAGNTNTNIADATASTFVLTQAQVSKTITVVVSYTDSHGEAEMVLSAATDVVTMANNSPTGTLTIDGIPDSGAATQGMTLTANITLVMDVDGLGTFTYQWQSADTMDGSYTAISNAATSATFVLTQAEVNKFVRVSVSYTDDGETAESLTSMPTTAVANVNDDPTGLTIGGTATQGMTLTANTTLVMDADGLGTFTYQWQSATVMAAMDSGYGAISGATKATFVLTQAQVGEFVRVSVSYTDGGGTVESLTATTTAMVADGNVSPTGLPTIDGTAAQGMTLTADISAIRDEDGLGTFAYQWQSANTASTMGSDYADITDATSTTFVLTQAQVDKFVRVEVTHTDAEMIAEMTNGEPIFSAATTKVTNANDDPMGEVTINGTAAQGMTLTADISAITDEDGLGTFTYQWQTATAEAGSYYNIMGATAQTLMLTQAQVGKFVRVYISYTDASMTAESLASDATSKVTNTNDASTGVVTISGAIMRGEVLTARQGQRLTAETGRIEDADGRGTFAYQWQFATTEGGNYYNITGATSTTFVLTKAQVDKFVRVSVTHTDARAGVEALRASAAVTVTNANDDPTGAVTITGTATRGVTLMADTSAITDPDGPTILEFTYQWQSADSVDGSYTAIMGATDDKVFALTQTQVGKFVRVSVSYEDAGGKEEGKGEAAFEGLTSAPTAAVSAMNAAPTGGAPTIGGTPRQNEVLTVLVNTIADADGLGTFTYQWQAATEAGSYYNIMGATAQTLLLTQKQVSKTIRAIVSYVDDGGTLETRTSVATAAVMNVNDKPTGRATISGIAAQDQILAVDTGTIADADGLGTGGFSYQWRADGNGISSADEATFVLTQAQVGATITVVVSYTDGGGTAESLTSAATSAVANVNDGPTGAVTIIISGAVMQGATLTADTSTITDADGDPAASIAGDGSGPFAYQWQSAGADGVYTNIMMDATDSTFLLTQAEVDEFVRVSVSYTDGGGTAESLTSAATNAVANVNDGPTGMPTITGTATQGMTLTADISAIMDEDGLGTFTYQWRAGNTNIKDATASTFVLTQAQVGATITVVVSYTDADEADAGEEGTSLTSAATSAVANVNDDPTGAVTISGTATLGATLRADPSAIMDEDGLGTFTYQWQSAGADGMDETILTGKSLTPTYVLAQAQVGKIITVTVFYTDGQDTNESLTSASTAVVTMTNMDPAGGSPTITGTATQGMPLTVNVTTIMDADSPAPATLSFTYQWQAAAEAGGYYNIMDATTQTLLLTQKQVGKTIRAIVSYTDGGGTAESLTSAATAAVTAILAFSPLVAANAQYRVGATLPDDADDALPEATGGFRQGAAPLTYTLTPDLPTGLSFNADNRIISGTPTAVLDTTVYTYQVTDSNMATASLTFSLTVNAAKMEGISEPSTEARPVTIATATQDETDGLFITHFAVLRNVVSKEIIASAKEQNDLTKVLNAAADGVPLLLSDTVVDIEVNASACSTLAPCKVSLAYTEDDLAPVAPDTDPIDPSDLYVFHFTGDKWVALASTLDRDAMTVTASVSTFSPFGLARVAVKPAGVTITPRALTIKERNSTTYTVVLDTAPTAAVTITPSSNYAEATATPTALTFTPTNWRTAQTVTLKAAASVDPAVTATISHAITSADEKYASLEQAGSVAVTFTDNVAPTAEVGEDRTVTAAAQVTLSGSGADTDGTIASYAWRQTGDGTRVTLSNNGKGKIVTFDAGPVNDAGEVLTFTFTVTDSQGAMTMDTVTITVAAVPSANSPPTANAGANQENVPAAAQVTLSGSGADTDGAITSYAWRQTGDGTRVTLSNNGKGKIVTFDASPAIDAGEDLTFILTVTDNQGAMTDSNEVTISVESVSGDEQFMPPTAEAGANQENVPAKTMVTLSGSATAGTGTTLKYAWLQTGDGTRVTLSNNGKGKIVTFDAGQAIDAGEDLTFILTVTDNYGAMATDTVTITVESVPEDQIVPEGTVVTLEGIDPDDEGATYSWRQTNGKSVTLSDASVRAPTFTAPNVRSDITLTFELTVTVGTHTFKDSVNIMVQHIAISVNAGENQTVAEEAAVTLMGSATTSPVSDRPLNYRWSQTSGLPMVALSGETTAMPTFTAPNNISENITLTFGLTVTVGTDDVDSYMDTVSILVSRNIRTKAINEAILPEIAAIISAQTAAAVSKRMAAAPNIVVGAGDAASVNQLKLGGHSSFASLLKDKAQGLQARRSLAFSDLLEQSEFSLSLRRLDASEPGACLNCFVTLWGAADYRDIKGRTDSGTSFNGKLLTGQIGADTGLGKRVLVGALAAFSDGEFNYNHNNNQGSYDVKLNSIHPYAGVYLLDNQLNLWATVGYGTGDITITTAANRLTSDLKLTNIGAGATGKLHTFGSQSLNLKAELSKSTIELDGADGIDALEVDVSRIRALLELTKSQYCGVALVDLSVASGVRYESGSGDSNFAAEITGSAKATIRTNNLEQPALSLQVDASFLKGQSDYEEWGIQGLIQLKTRQQTGLSFSLTPGYGTAKASPDNIWTEVGHSRSQQPTHQQQPGMQLKTRLDYRLRSNGFVTPYTEMDIRDTASTYTIGMRWQPTHRLDFDLSARQLVQTNRHSDQAVLLQTKVSF